MREEREKIIKNNKIYRIVVRTLLYLRWYCSLMPNILAFRTPQESSFLVFGVSNAKYLAFDTPDENALRVSVFSPKLNPPWSFPPTHHRLHHRHHPSLAPPFTSTTHHQLHYHSSTWVFFFFFCNPPLLPSAPPFLGHLHCYQLIHRFLVLIFFSLYCWVGLQIWVFALFGSCVASFVGCRGWLGRIMGHGGGWVVVELWFAVVEGG